MKSISVIRIGAILAGETKIVSLLVIALVCLCGYGCATIVHGTTQDIPCTTTPAGATVRTTDGFKCTTPCNVTLKRKEDHTLTFEKEGCEATTVGVHSVLSGAVAGNILAGGLIGWGVDAASGAQYRLVPETLDVTLKTSAVAIEPKPASGTGSVLEKMKDLAALKESGHITDQEFMQMKEGLLKEHGLKATPETGDPKPEPTPEEQAGR